MLIAAGADIEVKGANRGCSALLVASEFWKVGDVKVLVRAGADVCVTDNEGNTCLTIAAYCGHTETVRTLLCMPEVDVNHSNNSGRASLHRAVSQKHSDVVEVLIDAGADIDAKDDRGSTPLHWACEGGELDIVKMLVKAGAGVCEADDHGRTCLIFAAGYGHTETVRYLVGLNKVDVNHRDLFGHTALHDARQEQRADVEQVLLKHGAEE